MTTSTKVNSFTILKTKNQFILLCWKKKLWRMCTNFWINPHNGKLPSRLAPAQYQNSLTPQLLSNIYWSKTKTSISLNRVYWYDTMCHIFSCLTVMEENTTKKKFNARCVFFQQIKMYEWRRLPATNVVGMPLTSYEAQLVQNSIVMNNLSNG